MSFPPPFDPRLIPSSSTRAEIRAGAPVLVWVVAGQVTVTLGSSRWALGPGQALWIPGGHRALLRGSAESAALPIRIRDEDRAAGPSAPFVASPPSDAVPLLLAAFTRSLGVLHGGGVRAAALLGGIGHPAAAIATPPMPSSPDLRRVAEALLADPTRAPSAVGAARGLGDSVLARRFRAETGWTPVRWRTRHALGRAAEGLRAGRGVSGIAADAGYGSPQAFARAFRREWGVAPSALARGETMTTAAGGHRGDELGPQCNGYHIVVWVAAGDAVLGIDGETTTLRAGDLACLPAGTSTGFRAGPEAAVIPLGWLPGGMDVPAGFLARADDALRTPLLRLATWAYGGVEPVSGGDPRTALQGILGLREPGGVRGSVADAVYVLLERLAEHPEDGRSSAELAAQSALTPAELRDAVEALTGTTLATWRARTRMTWARRLLRDGLHPSQVARRVGYADAAAFSRAFRRAHGHSPSRFLASQSHHAP
ncbi:helix-turn-helix domain-containing protein [Streptomyces sp. MS2A]|nr:helix-turn-helix domain-containing protein [Streptomyces sp. MS2A]